MDDLIDGIIRLSELPENPRTPINIGNPTEFQVVDLAHEVMKQVPECQSRLVFSDKPVDDPHQRKPDITLAREILRWEPKIDLAAGLEKMIAYAKKELELA